MTTSVQHYVFGIGHPAVKPAQYSPPVTVESTEYPNAGIVVISSAAPDNGDGRPDGTIYVQTA